MLSTLLQNYVTSLHSVDLKHAPLFTVIYIF